MMEDTEAADPAAPTPGARLVPLVSSVPTLSVPVAPPVRGPISVMSVNGRLPDRTGNVFVPGISPETIDGKADKSTTYTKTETDSAISAAIATVTDSAPEAFDTLKEIADWIQSDPDGAVKMQSDIADLKDRNEFTNAEKAKLAGVEAGANKTVVDSALSGNSTNPVQNKVVTAALDNKITAGTFEPQSNRLLSLLAFVKQSGITLPESVYTTYGVDGLLALKANASDVTAALALKADAASLPYALVTVTPTAGAPFVLAACFPIKYVTRDETEVTVTAENAQTLSISGGYVVHDGLTIFYCNSNGTFAGEAEVDSVTFGDPATPPTSSTQVLGFTPNYALTDRAVNQVTLGSGVASVVFRFPAKTQGKARDFMLRLVVTGSTVPEIGFVESDGTTEVAFDADDDSWADIEQGVNILMFTDTQEASA